MIHDHSSSSSAEFSYGLPVGTETSQNIEQPWATLAGGYTREESSVQTDLPDNSTDEAQQSLFVVGETEEITEANTENGDVSEPIPDDKRTSTIPKGAWMEVYFTSLRPETYSHRELLELIPRDGRIDLAFNGLWSLERDKILNSIEPFERHENTDTESLRNAAEKALKDLGKFGVLGISDFDPNTTDRVCYRLSKNQLYVGTVFNGEVWYNRDPSQLRSSSQRKKMLPKCPTTTRTAAWNRIM